MKSKNIAIVVKHLGEGGAQRSAAILSLMLSRLGYKVTILALYGLKEFAYRGEYFELNKDNTSFKIINKYYQYLNFRRIIKRKKFLFIIDFRGRTKFFREFMIYNFIYQTPRNIIFTVRESKIDNYFPSPFFVFRRFYKKALKIMVVSKDIENKIREQYLVHNIVTINNGIDFKEIDNLKTEAISESSEYILAVGRLVKLKQFKKLIDIYSESDLIDRGIKLLIIGDGELEDELKQTTNRKRLNDFIKILPFQENPYKYMSKAKFLVLTSKSEGFPNVLIEALACGVPVISFDCETGPSEIIQHNKNGLLIENQNFKALGDAINTLAKDDKLYVICRRNARESVEKYNMEKIALEWNKLLQSN